MMLGIKVALNGSLTDNTQDDGAAFLTAGQARLYVPVEGSDFNDASSFYIGKCKWRDPRKN